MRPDGICGGRGICQDDKGNRIIESWRPYKGGWDDFYWDGQISTKEHPTVTGNHVTLVYDDMPLRESIRGALEILSFTPLAPLTSLGLTVMDIQDGNYLDAAGDLLGVVPGGGLLNKAGKAAKAIDTLEKLDRVNSAVDMALSLAGAACETHASRQARRC
ncbi:hypothetical protein AB0O31_10165 [Kitasatospora cineracea]|uniref:hypothetical protein n=1 Tax=Kitasatospora cineracea TaxID=88074 RepID=UPI0034280365